MVFDDDVATDVDLVLQTRMRPDDEQGDTSVRVWDSTYKTLIGIRAKMELSSREQTSIAQVIDSLARAVEKTKIKVISDDVDL